MRLRIATTALLVAGLLAAGAWSAARDIDTPRTLASTAYVGSSECKRCHDDHYASWHRTFHRTMTQDVSSGALLGRWTGETLDYMGVRARMHRDPAGHPTISFTRAGGSERWQARVERTVGSHRYQQYLARDRDVWMRLPIAWDVAEARFVHMNGAFLTPDPEVPVAGAAVSRSDYDRHVTRWNDNCIFCHNVRPNPGFDRAGDVFESEVAELGIACEACHGPGAEHVTHNRDPLRRYMLHASDHADPTIRNPARLSAERSAQVCGRCHGQRITPHIERYYEHGDTFIPGDDLTQHSTPLARDTQHDGQPGAFAARFWNDGTPRLTAYEYQGYLQSACRKDDSFTCESCHAMHAGDPKNQLRPDLGGDRMCTQCHEDLASPAQARSHTRHEPSSPGARCAGCHMPKIVYGLVSMHVSHRIELPDPARDAAAARPDACTLCHTDRTRSWAVRESARLFTARAAAAPAETPLSEIETRLLAGDPIERAAAASALGEPAAAFSATPRGLALLMDAMVADTYPAVRDIASRSARARLAGSARAPHTTQALTPYRATDLPSERDATLRQWHARTPDTAAHLPSRDLLDTLRQSATQSSIEIGE